MNQPNTQQQQGGQQNPLFGTAWIRKFCPVEWNDYCDKSPEHTTAATTVARESNADIKREFSPAGMGIVQAINLCKQYVERLANNGDIDSAAASDLSTLLDTLKERAKDDQKKKSEEQVKKAAGEIKKRTINWIMPATNPVVHSVEEYAAGMLPDHAAKVRWLLNEFIANLSDQQKTSLSGKFQEGIPKHQLAQIVRAPSIQARKDIASILRII